MDESYIHSDPLTTSLQQVKHNEISSDLAVDIIGLYRLLDLCNDDGSNGIVDKIIISKEQLRKLCNDMVPSSFKSISEINYTKLNSVSFRLIGCYGNRNLIAKLLLNRNLINQQIYDLLTVTASINDINKPSLRPGIYLLKVNSNLGLIIHWPEIECYVNSLSAASQIKRNMVNLHRYLTKLTDHQMCFMNDKDLENFDFNLENSDTNTDDDDDTDDEYEVKICQEEQEDFKINDGFKVNLSDQIKTEINNQIKDDIPLHPIVVESTTNQSFVTRRLIKKNSFEPSALFVFKEEFPTDLKNKLKDHYLRIDRKKMDMKALRLFIKYGLKMENLLDPLQEAITAAKKRNDTRKNREYDVIVEDIEIIKQMASIKLRAFESYFGKYIVQENPIQININNEDLKRIQVKYSGIENQIEEKIKIDSKKWKKMKKRYNLTCIVIKNMLEKINETENNDEMTKSAIKTFQDMFNDEISSKKLLEKYKQKTQQSKLNWVSDAKHLIFGDSDIKKAKQKTNDKSDVEFIRELVNFKLFEGHDNIKENIINTFIKEYHEWKKGIPNKLQVIFPNTQHNKQLEDNLRREFEKEKEETEKYMFEKICDEIENINKDGTMVLNVLSVKESLFTPNYDIKAIYNIEVLQPNKLQITIYEVSLKEDDKLRIQENESYIPYPTLRNQSGTSFLIDPQKYDFKKISQFDSRKFLLVLYNKERLRIEIFFDTAQRLAHDFNSSNSRSIKTLNADENFLIAINEPKGLLAIYNTKEAKLNVFSFDDSRSRLHGRNANIQLLKWYDEKIPNIKYFLFIKDTEELCFVENSGQARIFKLVNLQFRPAVCNFPYNLDLVNVLSSPDGSCIMAFTKEKLKNKPDEDNPIIFTGNKEQHGYKNDFKEINRVYVYFFENFGDSFSKEWMLEFFISHNYS